MRQIILDTETTGLNPEDGHRIIEIGCVELINRRLTENRFHVYLNPQRKIDQGALDVHGISNDFLADKPRFKDIVDDLLGFISAAELVIHNASFDVGFLNHELALLGEDYGKVEDYSSILDTLQIARTKHPGQRNSLDALCKRYSIDNSRRELHGALLDAEILADIYLVMTGGQTSLLAEFDDQPLPVESIANKRDVAINPKRKVIYCTEEENKAHESRLAAIEKSSGGRCLWKH